VECDRFYPLILFNDAQNQLTNQGMHGGWHTDTTAAHLMRAGRMQDAVLVAVEMHPDRNRAFFPAGDRKAPHGQAEIYTNFLADSLFDLLQSRYRLKRNPMTTGLIGSSNGAIHALFAGLSRPDTFGLIGCFSYAQMTPERNQKRIQQCVQPPFHKVYLDSGTRWLPHDEETQSDDNTMVTYRLRELLLQRGMVLERNLRYLLARGDAHNEHAWRRRLPGYLEFLLPPM
jgi:predicted alpha/beta superfamily hydrolase